MVNSLVLDEALSIPNIIDDFTQLDKNPYENIAKLINQKKNKICCNNCKGNFRLCSII